MITGFEDITHDLSPEELDLIPILVKGFKTHGEDNPIKSDEVVSKLNNYLATNGYSVRLTGPRLRKCCNYIRSEALIPLMATSAGYYVSYDPTDIRRQLESLSQRSQSIMRTVKGLSKFLQVEAFQ